MYKFKLWFGSFLSIATFTMWAIYPLPIWAFYPIGITTFIIIIFGILMVLNAYGSRNVKRGDKNGQNRSG